MEVKNCKNCGRLYNYIGGVYRLCPECMRKLEEKFQEVKDYIEDNPRADMREISEKCDVSTRQVTRKMPLSSSRIAKATVQPEKSSRNRIFTSSATPTRMQ